MKHNKVSDKACHRDVRFSLTCEVTDFGHAIQNDFVLANEIDSVITKYYVFAYENDAAVITKYFVTAYGNDTVITKYLVLPMKMVQ